MITLQEAQTAISAKVIDAVSGDASVHVVLQGTDDPYVLSNDQDAIIRISVNFGKILAGEVGPNGASRRIGVASLSIYTLWGEGAGRGLEVASLLENALRRIDLIAGSNNDEIFMDDPYTEGGFLTENTKYCYIVHAPFYLWVNE